jgi:phenylacetate-CoA ligase
MMAAKERLVHPRTFDYWPDVVAVDDMSRKELLELQARRLKALMQHVIAHVPFYRSWAIENSIDAEHLPSLEDWPVITKAVISADPDAFQSEAFRLKEMLVGKTSGSSGEPFRIRTHRISTDYNYAVLWRTLRRHGIRPGDRRAYIWGRGSSFNANAITRGKDWLQKSLRNWWSSTLPIDAYSLGDADVSRIIHAIAKFRPVYLHGYVSALYSIARHMLEQKYNFRELGLKAVITESEKLYGFQKEAMQAAFNCPVCEHYGSVEFGNIAQTDIAGQIRIAEDFFKLEAQAGGEVLVTNLRSLPYPFIRYKLGDIIEFAEPDKSDPLPYAVLTDIVGRTVDLIPVKGGGHVHGVAFAHVVDPHLEYVRQYQVRQISLMHFVVKLVAVRNKLPDEVIVQIRKDIKILAGEDAKVDVVVVDNIIPSASGKFRWVLSDVSA